MKPIEKMCYKELKEAQMKQKTLISNSNLLKSLPDKGKKLVDSFKKIDERLKNLEQFKDMSDGLQLLQINEMEWTGKIPAKITEPPKPDSDTESEIEITEEDETDLVKILLTSNQTSKIVIEERKGDFSAERGKTYKPTKCVENLMERVEHAAVDEKKFKPYSTLAKEPSDIRLQGPPVKKPAATHAKQMWENTAATPPKTKFEKGIIELGIEQSLQIQCETDDKLRSLELQLSGLKIGKSSNSLEFAAYTGDGKVNPDEEESEVYDNDDVTETCVVVTSNTAD